MSRVSFPRALVEFTALLNLSRTTDELQEVTSVVRPRAVTIKRNDFNTADTADIVLDVQNFPILPRMIRQVFCRIFMGDAKTMADPFVTDFAETTGDLVRFAGYVDDPEMSLDENDGTITWKLRDQTQLFLDFKRPPPDVVPTYQDNLAIALRRIMNTLEGGKNLKLRFTDKTGTTYPEATRSAWPELASVAPKALIAAKIPTKPDDSLWDLVKRCCDPLNVIPHVYLDTLYVSVSRGLLTPTTRPIFMYGSNLVNYKEKRQLGRAKTGIGISGYLASTRQPIYGLYPPAGDSAISRGKKPATPAKEGNPSFITGTDENRVWYPADSFASQAAIDDYAFQVYTQRARQEWEASFECRRMTVIDDTLPNDVPDDEATFDVLSITNGDRIMLGIEPDLRQMLAGLGDTASRVQFLVDAGYSEDVAPVMVRAFEVNLGGPIEAYVRTAEYKVDDTGFTGTFEVQNVITVQPSAETGVPGAST